MEVVVTSFRCPARLRFVAILAENRSPRPQRRGALFSEPSPRGDWI